MQPAVTVEVKKTHTRCGVTRGGSEQSAGTATEEEMTSWLPLMETDPHRPIVPESTS